MSRFLVLSVIVASLSTIVGCGASSRATQLTTTPASVNVAGARDEACWTPADEMAVSIKESPKAPVVTEATTATEQQKLKGSYRPNRNDRPTTGAVHAATY